MKKLEKRSLDSIDGKLTRNEMKTVMAAGIGDFVWGYIFDKIVGKTIEPMVYDYKTNYSSGKPASYTKRYADRGPY